MNDHTDDFAARCSAVEAKLDELDALMDARLRVLAAGPWYRRTFAAITRRRGPVPRRAPARTRRA